MPAKSRVSLVIIGAGGRGTTYAHFASEFPDRATVVGVAEPREFNRQRLANDHMIPENQVFADWRQVADRPRFADAVIIATQDRMHVEPAIAFADLGYHILLEKPMAPTADECHKIVAAVKRNRVLFSVGHVLRYTRYTQQMKSLLVGGTIGDIVGIQHLEPTGFWHMAHSFVRGNWRNESESGFMLLTKSCHDIDWIRYMMGTTCKAVSSFGSLLHFKRSEQPAGAASRCLDCRVELSCPYSAKRIYGEALRRGYRGWPVDVLAPEPSEETISRALREGPYGRCVYECDNDVVDHQVVNMLFEGGRTASFTMMAFTEMLQRQTKIFGTRGELTGDGRFIDRYDFLTDTKTRLDTQIPENSSLEGHGGGDYGLMDHFVEAIAEDNPSLILSGADETLESHLMVFAAEEARLRQSVVEL